MKKILLITSAIISLLLKSHPLSAQAPGWAWAKQVADTSIDQGSGIATDSIGNVYAVGYFTSNSIITGTNALTNVNPGKFDSYLIKYNAGGNVLWARSVGGSGDDASTSIATDKSGNVYVSGIFTSPTLTIGSTTFSNTATQNMFLVKYDSNGNVIWAKSANGDTEIDGNSLYIDGSGNAYLTGRYFGAITIGTYSLTYTGTYNDGNIFTAKFDSNGNVLWANGSGGTGTITYSGPSAVSGISVDGSGNAYVAAYTSCVSYTFGTTVLNNSAMVYPHPLLLKYDASGTPAWARTIEEQYATFSTDVVADAAGNTYITGFTFSPTFTFGPSTFTTAGGADMFVAKFDAAGNAVWATCAGGSSADAPNAITIDASGDIYLTGNFASPSASFGSTVLTRTGNQDAFVAKYDASGNTLWATSAFGNNMEGRSICVEPGGAVYVTGWYKDTTATFGSTILNNAGNYDAFVARLYALPLGIKENSLSHSVLAYPNPFSTKTTIKLDKPAEAATIRIYNVTGQMVKEVTNFNGADYVLSRENLETGLYFLQVADKNGIIASGKITVVN